MGGSQVVFCVLYLGTGRSRKAHVEVLRSLWKVIGKAHTKSIPILIGGDLNHHSADALSTLLVKAGIPLSVLPFTGSPVSFMRFRRGAIVQSGLDYFLVNSAARPLIANARVDRSFTSSDHMPIRARVTRPPATRAIEEQPTPISKWVDAEGLKSSVIPVEKFLTHNRFTALADELTSLTEAKEPR